MRPNPPNVSDDLKLKYCEEFKKRENASSTKEMQIRLKTAAVVSLILIITALTVTLGVYFSVTANLSSLARTFTILSTSIVGCGGVLSTTLIGVYIDLPAYQEWDVRENLNTLMSLEYTIQAREAAALADAEGDGS